MKVLNSLRYSKFALNLVHLWGQNPEAGEMQWTINIIEFENYT